MNTDTAAPILVDPLMAGSDERARHLPDILGTVGFEETVPPGLAECWMLAGASPDRQTLRRGEERMTLGELISREGSKLLGRQGRESSVFPLQIRMFEVTERQALQVCASPAGRRVGNSLFWYSLSPTADARVAVGIQHRITRGQFMQAIESPALWELLREFPAPAGDAFFMAPGVVFAADAGCVLLEVTRPVATRRTVSSWAAAAEDSRQAVEQIRFADRGASRIRKDVQRLDRSRKIPLVNISPDFDVDEIRVIDSFFGRTDASSPHVFCSTGQRAAIETSGGRVDLLAFHTCIVPANAGDYHVKSGEQAATVIRITPK